MGAGPRPHLPGPLRRAPAGRAVRGGGADWAAPGEITGLRWADVDLAARKIVVRRNRVTVERPGVEQQTTKTRAGLRTVPLSDFAVATLLAWQLRQAQEAEAAAGGVADRGARLHVGGRPAARPGLRHPAVPDAPQGPGGSCRRCQFHGLRHCAASLMLASGADIAVVSKLLGHACIAITSDVYGHLVGTIASDAVNGAANLIAHTVHTPEGVSPE